jgi:hypothetical protein
MTDLLARVRSSRSVAKSNLSDLLSALIRLCSGVWGIFN